MREPHSIFLFGDNISQFKALLQYRDIYTHRILEQCHPFAIVGKTDEFMKEKFKDIKDVVLLTQIKKNFINLLSRDIDQYESNYAIDRQPGGTTVDDCNRSDFMVVNFSGIGRPLYRVNRGIFSAYGSEDQNPFMKELKEHERIPFPFPDGFDWKWYMKQFADACLQGYDSDHLILLRTRVAEWYVEQKNIRSIKTDQKDLRKYIRMVEDYFLELTHCHCIYDAVSYLGCSEETTFQLPSFVSEIIADSIQRIADNPYERRKSYLSYSHEFIQRLYHRLTLDKQIEFAKAMDQSDRLEIDKKIRNNFLENPESHISKSLFNLSIFIDNIGYTLSEYMKGISLDALDFCVFEDYTKYFKLNVDDLVTVLILYQNVKNKEPMRKIIHNICGNSDCYPLRKMDKLIQKNQKYLQKYPYIDEELRKILHFDLSKPRSSYYFRINEQLLVSFQPSSDEMIKHFFWKSRMLDIEKIIQDHMICSIYELEELSKSWRFYIRRAKTGNGNTPLMVSVENAFEFEYSLLFLDYEKILESENAMISLKENIQANRQYWLREGYESKCNFEQLMGKNSKIFFIGNGFSDQINFYVYSKVIQGEDKDTILYYDDLIAREKHVFNGIEVDKVVKEDRENFRSRLLSNVISRQLRMSYRGKMPLSDFLYQNGWKDFVSLVAREMNTWKEFPKKCTCLQVVSYDDDDDVWKTMKEKYIKYYYYHRGCDAFLKDLNDIARWIQFPEFDDEINLSISKEMISNDAVVVHIRAGDYISISGADKYFEFYRKYIKNLLDISQYRNLKFYVFSDNIKFIRENPEKFGLDLVENVCYVTHNRRERSFMDLKLMSFGKIFIVGAGMYGRKAAQLSTRKEIFACTIPYVNDMWKSKGWKNKYEILGS